VSQSGSVSPILANIYLHYALDVWFEQTVKAYCQGAVYLCRYADDFVCVFKLEADAERFYGVLGNRLGTFGLEVAEEKTNLIRFSPVSWKASAAFEFLGFEFRWGLGRWCKPVINRRTARKKYRASLANFQEWCRKRWYYQIAFFSLNNRICHNGIFTRNARSWARWMWRRGKTRGRVRRSYSRYGACS
jgi:RNA-directed DNA polymerase